MFFPFLLLPVVGRFGWKLSTYRLITSRYCFLFPTAGRRAEIRDSGGHIFDTKCAYLSETFLTPN